NPDKTEPCIVPSVLLREPSGAGASRSARLRLLPGTTVRAHRGLRGCRSLCAAHSQGGLALRSGGRLLPGRLRLVEALPHLRARRLRHLAVDAGQVLLEVLVAFGHAKLRRGGRGRNGSAGRLGGGRLGCVTAAAATDEGESHSRGDQSERRTSVHEISFSFLGKDDNRPKDTIPGSGARTTSLTESHGEDEVS